MSYAFGPGSDPFGLSLPKWDLVTAAPSADSPSAVSAYTQEHAVGIDGGGEYLPDTERTFNKTTEISAEYISNTNGTIVLTTDVWNIVKALCGTATARQITEISVRTTNSGDQRARLALRGHVHGANTHTVNSNFPTMDADCTFDGYGASDFIICGFGTYDVISGDVTIRVGHLDRQGSNGDWLVGRSQGVMVEAKTSAISDVVPSGTGNPEVIGTLGWTLDGPIRRRPGNDFGVWDVAAHLYFPATATA